MEDLRSALLGHLSLTMEQVAVLKTYLLWAGELTAVVVAIGAACALWRFRQELWQWFWARLNSAYLTREEIKVLKRCLFAVRDIFVGVATFVSAVYLIKNRSIWPGILFLIAISYVCFRVYRRNQRRCPRCSGKVKVRIDGVEVDIPDGQRSRLKAAFGGWLVRANYYRKAPEHPRPKVSYTPGWWERLPPWKAVDPYGEPEECHYSWQCLICGKEYEVKEPEIKTFHRLRPFLNW